MLCFMKVEYTMVLKSKVLHSDGDPLEWVGLLRIYNEQAAAAREKADALDATIRTALRIPEP